MFEVLSHRFKPQSRAPEKRDHSAARGGDLCDRLFDKLQRYQSGSGLAGASVLIMSKTPDTLEALAAGQGAQVVWAPDAGQADYQLSIAASRPDFVLLEMEKTADIVRLTETYNRFRSMNPDIVIILCSEKFLHDETGPARPAFCDALVALPTTPEKLDAAACSAQKNRALILQR